MNKLMEVLSIVIIGIAALLVIAVLAGLVKMLWFGGMLCG